ncbi:hypothetical protein TcYC6_0094480 [Trypanosoma cruzi]|nr:hypothetical protein TcYC6_0094510 [Trypanosoma cruzi]KAF8295246.1 hypothetical protein TcYC6_0094480 [Trypanosoma cruzi]
MIVICFICFRCSAVCSMLLFPVSVTWHASQTHSYALHAYNFFAWTHFWVRVHAHWSHSMQPLVFCVFLHFLLHCCFFTCVLFLIVFLCFFLFACCGGFVCFCPFTDSICLVVCAAAAAGVLSFVAVRWCSGCVSFCFLCFCSSAPQR